MSFDALKSGLDSLVHRFLLVSLLPTTAGVLLFWPVLSACRTATVGPTSFDEAISLAAALHHAG